MQALDRIVREVELLRYSRSGSDEHGALRDDVLLCVEALEAGANPRGPAPGGVVAAVGAAPCRGRRPSARSASRRRFGGVVEHI